MKHARYIEFTNAEIAAMDDDHLQLRGLADFLWNDPRPHEEHKFDMGHVTWNWDKELDDAGEALSQCGTAACACGWEVLRSGDTMLFSRSTLTFGGIAADWMFGGWWAHADNSPFGASYRIDHYLKHREPRLYSPGHELEELMRRHYPADAFWVAS